MTSVPSLWVEDVPLDTCTVGREVLGRDIRWSCITEGSGVIHGNESESEDYDDGPEARDLYI